MALTYFWRCEATGLDGTHDYSAGATTMTLNGAASLSATAVKVGTNGVLNTDGADFYYCASSSIVTIDQGSIGYWWKCITSLPASTTPVGVGAEENQYTATDNYIQVRMATSGEVSAGIRSTGAAAILKTTTAANMVADTWYFITLSWHLSEDKLRVRVYDSAGALIDEANNDTDLTDLSASIPTTLDRLFIGQRSSSTVVFYVDNVFVGDSYSDADTFLVSRDITSYTSYAAGTKYVKLLVEASAASEASVEGVVLNATRDTVIGEFSGQTFEASLEGGEAVLLIDVADISPDGSTLTTSDTPIVFAYNATNSIIGPGSATVVEI